MKEKENLSPRFVRCEDTKEAIAKLFESSDHRTVILDIDKIHPTITAKQFKMDESSYWMNTKRNRIKYESSDYSGINFESKQDQKWEVVERHEASDHRYKGQIKNPNNQPIWPKALAANLVLLIWFYVMYSFTEAKLNPFEWLDLVRGQFAFLYSLAAFAANISLALFFGSRNSD
jgi:hypothetical protein